MMVDSLRVFDQFLINSLNDNDRVVSVDGAPRKSAADAGIIGRKLATSDGKTTQAMENNNIRTQLMNALNDQFKGGIPESVKKALCGSSLVGGSDMSMGKNNKVNSGRPLTARRIRAVVDAARKEMGMGASPKYSKETMSALSNVQDLSKKTKDLSIEDEQKPSKQQQKTTTKTQVSQKRAVKNAPAQKLLTNKKPKAATGPCVNDDSYSRPHGLKGNEALPKGIFFGQTPEGSTCAIIASMNALLASSEKNAESVRQAMTIHSPEEEGGYYEFNTKNGKSYRIPVKDCEFAKEPNGSFSQFEVAAYLALKEDRPDRYPNISSDFEMDDVLNLLGRDSIFPVQISSRWMSPDEVSTSIGTMEAEIVKAIKSQRMCLFNTGGHFVSVIDANQDKEGKWVFSMVESLPDESKGQDGPHVMEMTLADLLEARSEVDVYIEGYDPFAALQNAGNEEINKAEAPEANKPSDAPFSLSNEKVDELGDDKLKEILDDSRTKGDPEQRAEQREKMLKDYLLAYVGCVKEYPRFDNDSGKVETVKNQNLETLHNILSNEIESGKNIDFTGYARAVFKSSVAKPDSFLKKLESTLDSFVKSMGGEIYFSADKQRELKDLIVEGENRDTIKDGSETAIIEFLEKLFEDTDSCDLPERYRGQVKGPVVRELLYKALIGCVEAKATTDMGYANSPAQSRTFLAGQVGGWFKSEQTYAFEMDLSGGNGNVSQLTSTFSPVPQQNPGERKPVANLGISSLKARQDGEEKTLVSFVRFGQVGAWDEVCEADLYERTDDKEKVREDASTYHYLKLAEVMLGSDPDKLAKADPNGTVEVPIFRIDMCGDQESELTLPDQVEGSVEVDVGNGQVEKRNVVSKLYYFHVPIDDGRGYKTDTVRIERTKQDLKLLLEKAEEQANSETVEVETKRKINTLADALKSFNEEVLAKMTPETDLKTSEMNERLLRFGSKVALLVSLLGNKPAINCNCGRDRTGAMDSEIKLLACRLENEKTAATPPNKLERTAFLNMTGNNEIAFLMNGDGSGINVNQGSAEGADVHYHDLFITDQEGFHTL